MLTRRDFAVRGLSSAMLAAAAGTVSGQVSNNRRDSHSAEHDSMLEACAKACSDCQRACDSCATHCAHLLSEGHKEHLPTLGTCRDCADFCGTAAEIVARGGPFASLICQGCAEACARCAQACEKFPDDEHMKQCAAECRKCEKACREMTQHDGAKS